MMHYFANGDDLEGIGALGLDPWAILAQGLTFLVLFYIVKKYALEKIVTTLQERHKKIDSGVRLGIKMEKELEQLQKTIEQKLHEASLDADKILDDAHQESSHIIKAAEEKAANKVAQMLTDAEAKITSDMEKAQQKLRAELVELVAAATETVIEEKLTSEKDMRLIERAIAEASR